MKQFKKMGFSVGVDIDDISRFEKMALKPKESLKRVYTENEINYCLKKKKPAQHLAARFCAKEAVIKALSGLGYKTYYRRIEVTRNTKGVPGINLLDKKIAKDVEIVVSLTHSKSIAQAFVLAMKRE